MVAKGATTTDYREGEASGDGETTTRLDARLETR